MNFFKNLIIVVVIMIALLFGFLAGKKSSMKNINNRGKNIEKNENIVKISEISKKSTTEKLYLSGTVESTKETVISAEISGKIKKIYVNLGDEVKKDQILLEIDNDAVRQAYISATTSLKTAELNYKNAELNYNRQKELFNNKNISSVELEKSELAYENAKVQYESAKAQMESAKKQYDAAIIKAPFNGIISNLKLKEYQDIKVGNELLSINGKNEFVIYTGVSENDIVNIKKNANVNISFDFNPDKIFKGKIAGIGSKLQSNFTYPIKITFTTNDNNILPGMTANLEIDYRNYDNVILIPITSVLKKMGKYYVYTLEDSLAKEKEVKIKNRVGDNYIIDEGLNVGEKLIIEGIEGINGNSKLKVNKE